MKTILITGPESTGKTSLAKALSQELSLALLPEYARTYLETQGPEYLQETLLHIAKEHLRLYKARQLSESIILDSFLLNIKIWSLEKFNACDAWILEELQKFQPDLVLLCKPDIPWVSDPLRENPKDRSYLFSRFVEELNFYNWNYHIVDAENRGENITKTVKEFLSKV